MTDPRELLATVEMGLDAQAFLDSRIGMAIVARAEEERELAVDELKTADPENAKMIRALQNRIWRAEQFQYWIAEMINAGTLAEEQLQEGDS